MRQLRAVTAAVATLWVVSGALAAEKPDSSFPTLKPAHAEIPPTFWELHGGLVIALGAAVVVVVLLVAWFLTRPKPAVVIPPAELARRALQELNGKPEDGVILSRVSQLLRHYWQKAFALPAGELTTAEFCRAAAENAATGPELALGLADFLRRCDERKFAPGASGPALGAVGQALQLVEKGEARLAQLREEAGRTENAK